MTMAEKILAAHVVGAERPRSSSRATRSACASTAATRTSSPPRRCTPSSTRSTAPTTASPIPAKFAVFEDHLIYADGVPKMAPFSPKIQVLRDLQRAFQKHTGVQDYSARRRRLARHLPHRRARADHRARRLHPGHRQPHLHGRRGRRARLRRRRDRVRGARPRRLHLRRGARVDPLRAARQLRPGVTAKDVMLYILANHAKQQLTLDRVMEFGGPGLRVALARRARHAGQHGHRVLGQGRRRRGRRRDARVDRRAPARASPSTSCARRVVAPDRRRRLRRRRAHDRPVARSARWWRTPGDPTKGIPSDPTNGAYVAELGDVAHRHRLRRLVHRRQRRRHRHVRARDAGGARGRPTRRRRRRLLHPVRLASAVEDVRAQEGLPRGLRRTRASRSSRPAAAPASAAARASRRTPQQVTVSAINRNYQNRSGPGQLYLASPLNVAASAVAGKIVAYEEGMFQAPSEAVRYQSVLHS